MPLESTRPWEINACAVSCDITPNNPAPHYLGPIMFHLTNRQSGGKSIICGLHMPLYIPSPLTYSQTYTHSHMHSHGRTHSTWTGCNGPLHSLGMSSVQIHSILGVPTHVHTHTQVGRTSYLTRWGGVIVATFRMKIWHTTMKWQVGSGNVAHAS